MTVPKSRNCGYLALKGFYFTWWVYIQNFQYDIFMNNLQTLYKITEILKIPVSEVILIIILQSKKWIQTTRT